MGRNNEIIYGTIAHVKSNHLSLACNEQRMHAEVLSLFNVSREDGNVLYTVFFNTLYDIGLFIQSTKKPTQEATSLEIIECFEINRYDSIQDNDKICFKVAICPESRGTNRKKIIPKEQKERLEKVKSIIAKQGITPLNLVEQDAITKHIFKPNGNSFPLNGYNYECIGIIEDAEKAKAAFITGLSPKRAYGFGQVFLMR